MIDDRHLLDICRHLFDEAVEGDEGSEQQLDAFTPELERIALAGDSGAQDLLGGVALVLAEDETAAARWFALSAAAGSPVGARSLGHLYAQGAGVPRDTARALELFRAAVAGGDASAKATLGRLARAGVAELPAEETLGLLTEAAGAGIAEASAELGDLLAEAGRPAEALARWTEAAAAGHERATVLAAECYRDGVGTEADPVRAVQHYLMLLDHHSGAGVPQALALARHLTDDQVREACRLAGRDDHARSILDTVRD
ncbi:tetratricopeptide repeat protein [Kitasatospora sp. NPDC048365]|uniref:tetratricopeptide repeat protein n=1 Tax=Kitasatospora sp. NPDC048365 TaxID=3364050 RepID=UPI003716DCF0